ncbi:carbonic anhydrase 12-like [Patiria miniata]|uniref:carbonic anhydrase n=1 Tax=Patiria miniata TaxID=46514 RepID=A0A914BU71_PATMI|nr:carbonic anhydrase 12-like [Patiria miniata]
MLFRSFQGPHNWYKAFPKCAGKNQSPIEINEKDTTRVNLGNLKLEGFFKNDKTSISRWGVANDGLKVYINLEGTYYISKGGLEGRHKAYNLYFNWGRVDGRGSEHKLDGKFYDGEIQIVSYSMSAQKQSGFVTMIKVVEKDNPLLKELINAVKKVKYRGEATNVPTLDNLADLLSPDFGNFYRYEGSRTWPECTTGVTWTVWRTPLEMGRAQMEEFRGLYNKEKGTADNIHIADTVRPLQPRDGRKIEYNSQHNYRTDVEASI